MVSEKIWAKQGEFENSQDNGKKCFEWKTWKNEPTQFENWIFKVSPLIYFWTFFFLEMRDNMK